MTRPSNPVRHLAAAAEAVRKFNHTSQRPGADWEFPSASYRALGNLTALAQVLRQAIEQSTRPVMRTYEHGRVLIDGGGDADLKVAELVDAERDALSAAQALADALSRMHVATSPMGLDTEGMPGFNDDSEA